VISVVSYVREKTNGTACECCAAVSVAAVVVIGELQIYVKQRALFPMTNDSFSREVVQQGIQILTFKHWLKIASKTTLGQSKVRIKQEVPQTICGHVEL